LPTTPEFSRPVALASVPPGGTEVALSATPEECRALARRFDLDRLDRLAGEIRLEHAGRDLLHVSGRVRADLAQRCVVTFEPVPATVDAGFERLFSADVAADAKGEVEVDALAEEPEPMPEGGALDLGEILAEELSLALDPYPRAPDADRRLAEATAAGDAAGAAGPFGALARLRKH
jgi:uncharacterized metal-binding protein YceD (DUF177 family)